MHGGRRMRVALMVVVMMVLVMMVIAHADVII
jgi:hypothetical protein